MKPQFSVIPRQIDKFLTANKGSVPTHWDFSSADYLYHNLRNCIRVAKHFELPDREIHDLGDGITQVDLENTINNGVRLPYPAITISRKVGGESLFLVAWDRSMIEAIAIAAKAKLDPPTKDPTSTIYMHGFILNTKGDWIPDVLTLMFEGDHPLEHRMVNGRKELGTIYKIFWADKNAVQQADADNHVDNFTEHLYRDVVELCTYLNRSSTTLETRRESSLKAKLGSKKKGQNTFYEIHRVVVNAAPKVVEVSEHKGGTHASPRWHERRGYWRTMKKSGKRVWVRACEVGSKSNGMVYKDYEVKIGE